MFVITNTDSLGTWYFKQFGLFGCPEWVGKKKMKEGEVRTFETRAEARSFINGMLSKGRKYGIEEIKEN